MAARLLPESAMSAARLPAGGTLRTVGPDAHGLGDLVVTTSEHPPGEEVPIHKHTCGEIFVVTRGRGRFTVDGEVIVAGVGDMVVVPTGGWHGFTADGDQELRLVSAFDGSASDAAATFPADSPLAVFNPPSA